MFLPVSVIICSHNPRGEYLAQALAALKEQTLSKNLWELLLIDNASNIPLEKEWDLTWHPNSKHVIERDLGLTPARLRGIRESKGDLLVFVDDDNVLDRDYLERALEISKQQPMAGAFGAGEIRGVFECKVPPEIVPHLPSIAVAKNDRDNWSNALHDNRTLPYGAGLCVSRVVAKHYSERTSDIRRLLDRRGQNTVSCGDSDLALTACDLGMLTGQVTALKLNHLIPEGRVTPQYFEKLMLGLGFSMRLLAAVRGQPAPPKRSLLGKTADYFRYIRKSRFERMVQRALSRGAKDAERLLQQLSRDLPDQYRS